VNDDLRVELAYRRVHAVYDSGIGQYEAFLTAIEEAAEAGLVVLTKAAKERLAKRTVVL
jgi:hypothetical protein